MAGKLPALGSPSKDGLAGDAGASAEDVRGQRLGRYFLIDQLGAGGMGVVFSAYDPELDRRVAIKVLRPEAIAVGSKEIEHTLRLDEGGEPRDLVREQLLTEGRAMARLSHPNLPAIYEVGEVDERVFLAMEHVEGVQLSVWLAQEERSWREVVAVFVQAGRALAAAHAGGLVHGDFKPDNVLIEASGRARVLDFGLARAVGTRAERQGLMGTPRYMAPEQFARHPVDARSDQFAFCAALYEALYRARPFAGESDAEIAAAVTAGRVQAPARRRGPRWLERAIMTGLATNPESRFSSMQALLAVLERRPLDTRRRIALAATAVMAVGLIALGFAFGREPDEDRCTGGQAELARVWGPGAAERLRAAFAATGRVHASTSAARATERIGAYTQEWTAMHRNACRATARGEQSADLLDRRMVCLERRLGQLDVLLDLFFHRADVGVVDKAIDLVAGLEPLSRCAESAALLEQSAPPTDPAVRARVAEVQRQIDRANAERLAGRAQIAEEGARAALEAARALDHASLEAQAGRVLGRAIEERGRPTEAKEALFAALRRAERAGDKHLAVQILIEAVQVVGTREKKFAEAAVIGQIAAAAVERLPPDGSSIVRAHLLNALGTIANEQGDVDRGVELLREALGVFRRPPIQEESYVALTEGNLGYVLVNKGSFQEARAHLYEALSIWRRVRGDQHPNAGRAHLNLGYAYMTENRVGDAYPHLLAALAIFEGMPEHQAYFTTLNNLGNVEIRLGHYDRARTFHERALELRQRHLGPDHVDVALSLYNLGNILREVGVPAEALELHRRALAIREKRDATKHPQYAFILMMIGEDLRQLGRPAESLPYQEKASEIIRGLLGEKHPDSDAPEAYEGLALFDMGRGREAIPRLERALLLVSAPAQDRARVAFALARTLDPRGPRSERSVLLSLEALTTFALLRSGRELDQVAAYLARAPRR